jgi:hypothetical protein
VAEVFLFEDVLLKDAGSKGEVETPFPQILATFGFVPLKHTRVLYAINGVREMRMNIISRIRHATLTPPTIGIQSAVFLHSLLSIVDVEFTSRWGYLYAEIKQRLFSAQ